MKPATLASLASGSRDAFTAARDACAADGELGALLGTSRAAWEQKISVQVDAFSAAAHYWQSKAEHDRAQAEGKGYVRAEIDPESCYTGRTVPWIPVGVVVGTRGARIRGFLRR